MNAFSRRRFITRTAGAFGTAVGASLLGPTGILAARPVPSAPKPTPTSFSLAGQTFHIGSFAAGNDPSSIADFNGFVGVADVQGTGTATNPDGSTETLLFDTDMRFMKGVYIGEDGAVHRGAFVLI